jgi:hypothetical protein
MHANNCRSVWLGLATPLVSHRSVHDVLLVGHPVQGTRTSLAQSLPRQLQHLLVREPRGRLLLLPRHLHRRRHVAQLLLLGRLQVARVLRLLRQARDFALRLADALGQLPATRAQSGTRKRQSRRV